MENVLAIRGKLKKNLSQENQTGLISSLSIAIMRVII